MPLRPNEFGEFSKPWPLAVLLASAGLGCGDARITQRLAGADQVEETTTVLDSAMPRGNFDLGDPAHLAGWVCDPDNTSVPIEVHW